jgi:hypothetical protein
MKWTYQESDVEITVRNESSPIVEIILDNGETKLLRTTMSFPSVATAEQYGRDMARQWIESHSCEGKSGLTDKSIRARY